MRRTYLAATAIIGLLAVMTPQESASSGQPIVDKGSVVDAGELVDQVATNIWGYNDPEFKNVTPLAGVVVDESLLTVDYWWKGEVPADLQQLLNEVRGPVTVTAHAANFSQAEMQAAGNRVFAASRAKALPPVTRVDLPMEGTGIGVGIAPGKLLNPATTKVLAGEVAAMPVTVSELPAPNPMSRQNDSDPWLGGSAMSLTTNPANADCSTAFSVIVGAGDGRLLSAYHCDPTSNFAWRDGAGDPLTLGAMDVDGAPSYDSMLIDPIGGTDGYVYGGPWFAVSGDARYKLGVTGKSAVSVGSPVCSSGANSGEHCGLTVRGYTQVSCPSGSGGTCTAWWADAVDHRVAVAGGDSGGPIYKDHGDGTVGARGVINSGSGVVTCPSLRSPAGPDGCDYQVFFISIMPVLSIWNASIEIQ